MINHFARLALLATAIGVSGPAFAQVDSTDITAATSAVLAAGRTAFEVSHLHQVPSVGVIRLGASSASPFSRLGDDITAIKIYADNNAGGVSKLRHALASNPVTRRALAENHVSPGEVLGVVVGSSGSLRLYTK